MRKQGISYAFRHVVGEIHLPPDSPVFGIADRGSRKVIAVGRVAMITECVVGEMNAETSSVSRGKPCDRQE